MTDRMIEYALIASAAILLVWLVVMLRQEYLRRHRDYRSDLAELRSDPVPPVVPAFVAATHLRLSRETVRTDCMAKSVEVEVRGATGWEVAEAGGSTPWLLAEKLSEGRLRLGLLTNFSTSPRETTLALHAAGTDGASLLIVQCGSGYYPELDLSDNFFIQPGAAIATVYLRVTPGALCDEWYVASVNTNDEGGWCEVSPAPGESARGEGRLIVRTQPKPPYVAVRNALVTLGCGTYPFQTLRTLVVSQGVEFDYYIEYPAFDACSRSREVIEVSPSYHEGDALSRYTVYVRANLPWQLVKDGADWLEVGDPVMLAGEPYNGRFTVTVFPPDESTRVKGFCPARHTIVRLVAEQGQVYDIGVYRGGYVMMQGRRWLDRNLGGRGELADNAFPAGLEQNASSGSRLVHGALFQFGCPDTSWKAEHVSAPTAWNLNTDEHPVRNATIDPSPAGWRVPSSLELSGLFNRSNSVPSYAGRSWAGLLSDDGVPVCFPLAGYRYHMSGCHMEPLREGGYWSSSTRSPVYADALLLRSGRPWLFTHQLKKQAFSVRSVEEGDG